MTLRISVVVPTYKRPALLQQCLAALLAQTLPPNDYEIIVVDDEGSTPTEQLVASLNGNGEPALRYVPAGSEHGPAAARNLGWRHARAPLLAFTDDDCLPEPDWLEQGLAAFSRGADAVAGRIVVPLPEQPTDYQLNAAELELAAFATANCFCRRDCLAAVGGFDQRYALAWREDSDLHFALLTFGARLCSAPEAVVVHPLRPAPWGVSVLQQPKSMYNALLYKKHPGLYRRFIQPSPPWHYYRITAALLAAVAASLSGRRHIALASAAAWALLTASFARRRLRGTSRSPQHIAEMVLTSALLPPLSLFWRLRGAVTFRVWFM